MSVQPELRRSVRHALRVSVRSPLRLSVRWTTALACAGAFAVACADERIAPTHDSTIAPTRDSEIAPTSDSGVTPTSAAQSAAPMKFDSGRAYEHLRRQVGFGPRPSGSAALTQTRQYILAELKAAGIQAREDAWDAQTP